MRSRTLGRTGVSVSEIGFGAWAIGGGWGEQKDERLGRGPPPRARPRRRLHRHRGGLRRRPERASHRPGSEGADGDGLRGHEDAARCPARGRRAPYCRADERYSEAYLRANVEERLRNLGTERIDLLQLHTWTRAWNRNPRPFEVLRKLQSEGKIGLIGVSTPEQDQNSVIDLMRGGWVDAVQVIYNIFEQEPAAELAARRAGDGVGVIVRVAFDEGALTGKFTTGDEVRRRATSADATSRGDRLEPHGRSRRGGPQGPRGHGPHACPRPRSSSCSPTPR